jgi:hypothetical protein
VASCRESFPLTWRPANPNSRGGWAEIVGVRLIAAVCAHGLALALPEKAVMARPTGFERARTHPGFKLIPIEGTEEWRVADRDSA